MRVLQLLFMVIIGIAMLGCASRPTEAAPPPSATATEMQDVTNVTADIYTLVETLVTSGNPALTWEALPGTTKQMLWETLVADEAYPGPDVRLLQISNVIATPDRAMPVTAETPWRGQYLMNVTDEGLAWVPGYATYSDPIAVEGTRMAPLFPDQVGNGYRSDTDVPAPVISQYLGFDVTETFHQGVRLGEQPVPANAKVWLAPVTTYYATSFDTWYKPMFGAGYPTGTGMGYQYKGVSVFRFGQAQ